MSQDNLVAAKLAEPITSGATRRGTLVPNVLSNIASFAISLGIGIWFTPYLIQSLGAANYGLIPLSLTIVSYLSIMTVAVSTSVSRSMTIAFEKNDDEAANRVFNSSLWICGVTAAVIAIPAALSTAFIDSIISVPQGSKNDAMVLFGLTAAAFVVNMVMTPFSVSMYCRNRFDIQNLINVLQNLVRVGLVICLFEIATASIRHVGFGIIGAGCVAAIGAFQSWRYLTPSLQINRALVDKSLLPNLLKTGFWVTVFQLGTVLFLSIDLVVVNKMFGSESSGRYAAVLQWSLVLRSIATTIAGVFGPTLMGLYGRDEIEGLVHCGTRAVKFVGYLIGLPVGLVAGLSSPLLTVWLGEEFSELAPLLAILVMPLCVNLAVLPLFTVSLSADKVRIPGLLTLVLGIFNLVIAVTLAGPLHFGLYGVAIAGGIVLSLKNFLFTPMYAAHNIGYPLGTFMRPMAFISLASLGLAVAAFGVTRFVPVASWADIICVSIVLAVAYSGGVFTMFLDARERLLVIDKAKRIVRAVN